MTVIYHGTPLTPRAALLNVCAGRAMCVSFFRPDDVEAVEGISPDIMFRQWGVLNVEGCTETRGRLGREVGLGGLLPMARNAGFSSGKMGGNSRYAGSAKPAQRCAIEPVAFRAKGSATLAYGCTDRATPAPL